MGFPKEIIEELLIRLPLKSVTKFRCVSKDWNNLISGVEFRKWYQSRHRNSCPIGFVYHPIRPNQEKSIDIELPKFVCTSNIDYKADLSLCHDLQDFGEIIGFSKGLILFSRNNTSYHVYDPLTRKHVQLPETLERCGFAVTGFICKEREQTHVNSIIDNSSYLTYTVIRIGTNAFQEKATKYEVQTYSSETRKWHKSMMTITSSEYFLDPERAATVVGGVLYWENSWCQYITAYDPEDPLGRAKLIEIPISDSLKRLATKGTQDGRLLCMWEIDFIGIDVWVLEERVCQLDEDMINRNRWTLLHKISRSELAKSFLDFLNFEPTSYEVVGFHHQDSNIIYLRMIDEFISYNLKENRVESIVLKGEESEESIIWVVSYFYLEWPSWPCLM